MPLTLIQIICHGTLQQIGMERLRHRWIDFPCSPSTLLFYFEVQAGVAAFIQHTVQLITVWISKIILQKSRTNSSGFPLQTSFGFCASGFRGSRFCLWILASKQLLDILNEMFVVILSESFFVCSYFVRRVFVHYLFSRSYFRPLPGFPINFSYFV